MIVIEVGDLRTVYGNRFCGILIEASPDEIKEIAGNILYREVVVSPVQKSPEALWGEKMDEMCAALMAVDERVRGAKPTRKYTRDEVMAMLDEIDPSKVEWEARNADNANGGGEGFKV